MTSLAKAVAISPLRISLAGGSTDLPSFYRRRGGLVIGMAITRYVGVRTFPAALANPAQPRSVLLANVFGGPAVGELLNVSPKTRVSHFSDVSPGSGLGGSGAFLVSLIRSLRPKGHLGPDERSSLADLASSVESDYLKRGSGRQDHLFAAVGGFRALEFSRSGEVDWAEPLLCPEQEAALLRKLALFRVGDNRDAARFLREQHNLIELRDRTVLSNMEAMLEVARFLRERLRAGDLEAVDEAIALHWRYKQAINLGTTSASVKDAYQTAMSSGATAAKLLGAGGSGYLLVSSPVEDKRMVADALQGRGYHELTFGIDHLGTRHAQLEF